MTRDTELKLFGAIDLVEGALNRLSLQGTASGDVAHKLGHAKALIQEGIALERKVIDGNQEHPHRRTQTG